MSEFAIADFSGIEGPRAKSDFVDPTQRIRFSTWTIADRARRQTIEAIQTCETPEAVEDFVRRESLLIDALHLFDPDIAASVDEAARDQIAWTTPRSEPRPAEPGHTGAPVTAQSTSSKGKTMFTIDTGSTDGSQGPWLAWSSEGSARAGVPAEAWKLTFPKDEHGNRPPVEVVPAFASGCVLDLDSLKLGWEKDGAKGQAPERRWNPSIAQATPRPDDSQKPQGGYAWSRALSVRCAIGGGRAATWEQSAFGAMAAFDALAKQIMAEWPIHSQNGVLLPLVIQESVERRSIGNGSTSIPVLKIQKWVPRPKCLMADAPTIATAPQPAPAPVAPPAPAPQPAAVIPDDAEF